MNIPLLRKVQAAILTEPEITPEAIAGFMVAPAPKKPYRKIRLMLGLSERQFERFQYKRNWPVSFYEAWLNAKTRKQHAGVYAKRIDHFIATEGRE